MARFHVQETVYDTEDNPLDGATVSVCVLGTTELSREPLYADDSSATLLANPLTSDGSGVVEFYLANPLACDLVPVKDGVAGQTITVRPGRPAVGDVPTWDGQQDVHQAASGGVLSIAFSGITVEASTSADTTAALTVDDPTQQFKVGAWANSVAGDLVLPQSGWYEVVLTATIAASGDGGNLLELLLNSDDSDLLCDFKVGGSVAARLPVHAGTDVQHQGVLIGRFQATAGQTIGGVYLYQIASGGSLSVVSQLHVGVRISLVAAA